MHAETLKELLDADPFHRLTVHTVSGRHYTIDHPEMAWMTRGGRTVYINLPDGEGERVHIVDTALVERIEPSKAPMPP
jgi:hypothetical protein